MDSELQALLNDITLNIVKINARLEKMEGIILKLDKQRNDKKPNNTNYLVGKSNPLSDFPVLNTEQEETAQNIYKDLVEKAGKLNIRFTKGSNIRDSIRRIKIAIQNFNKAELDKFFYTYCLDLKHSFLTGPLNPSNNFYNKLVVSDRVFDINNPEEFLKESIKQPFVIKTMVEYNQIRKEEELIDNMNPDRFFDQDLVTLDHFDDDEKVFHQLLKNQIRKRGDIRFIGVKKETVEKLREEMVFDEMKKEAGVNVEEVDVPEFVSSDE